MKLHYITLLVLVFLLGWIGNTAIDTVAQAEQPFSFAVLSPTKAPELRSPSDHIAQSQIHVFSDRIVLDIQNASWSSFTNTNSMDPFIDETSNGIEIRPHAPDDINIGDVISYHSTITEGIIIHRVVSKGTDEDGTYYIVKGDNNPSRDPEKVRFQAVHGVLVGIVY